MSKETGGQAFPRQQWEYDGQNNVLQYQEEGMTLRDYMAAKAMQALIPAVLQRCEGLGTEYPENNRGLAKAAYEVADAMIAVRG